VAAYRPLSCHRHVHLVRSQSLFVHAASDEPEVPFERKIFSADTLRGGTSADVSYGYDAVA
jgi:hypothetical protein